MKYLKHLKQVILIVTVVTFTSCATFEQFQQWLGTPAAVQTEISLLGQAAKSHIPADAQAKIHQFATILAQTADLNLEALFALLPTTTGSQNGDALIAAAKSFLTSAVQRYGANNGTTIAYAHAVAAGLLANF